MTDNAPIAEFTDRRITAVAQALSAAGIVIDRVRFARIALAAADTRTDDVELADAIAQNLDAHGVRFDVQKISAVTADTLASLS